MNPPFVIRSWPDKKKFYVEQRWYYDTWFKEDGGRVISGTVLCWLGTWQECVDWLRRKGW